MSQRFGMADGRCFTLNQSNQLIYESIARQLNINPLNSREMRMTLESKDQVPISGANCGIFDYSRNQS